MILLVAHIIISLVSLIGLLWVLVKSVQTKTSRYRNVFVASSIGTVLSAISGLLLISGGASITRVCIEGGALILVNVGLYVYLKNLERPKITA